MDIKLDSAALALARGELVRIDHAHGTLIRCVDGVVWITQDGDRRDYLLSRGGSLVIDGDGPALVEATQAATLRIEHTAPDESLEPWWNPFWRPNPEVRGTA
jgi:hypothetical protein